MTKKIIFPIIILSIGILVSGAVLFSAPSKAYADIYRGNRLDGGCHQNCTVWQTWQGFENGWEVSCFDECPTEF